MTILTDLKIKKWNEGCSLNNYGTDKMVNES